MTLICPVLVYGVWVSVLQIWYHNAMLLPCHTASHHIAWHMWLRCIPQGCLILWNFWSVESWRMPLVYNSITLTDNTPLCQSSFSELSGLTHSLRGSSHIRSLQVLLHLRHWFSSFYAVAYDVTSGVPVFCGLWYVAGWWVSVFAVKDTSFSAVSALDTQCSLLAVFGLCGFWDVQHVMSWFAAWLVVDNVWCFCLCGRCFGHCFLCFAAGAFLQVLFCISFWHALSLTLSNRTSLSVDGLANLMTQLQK